MAKGKNSVALFEVIRAAQQKQQQQLLKQQQQAQKQQARAQQGPTRSASDLLWQPIYWFKGKLAAQQTRDALPGASGDDALATPEPVRPITADAEVDSLRQTLSKYDLPTQHAEIVPDPAPAEEVLEAEVTPATSFYSSESRASESHPEPVRILHHPDVMSTPSMPRSEPLPSAAIPFLADPAQVPQVNSSIPVSHDADFRLSYVALIAAGFAIIAAVGLAIMFGRSKDDGAIASVQKDPSVLDIRPQGSGNEPKTASPANPNTTMGSQAPERTQTKIVPPPANPITPPSNVERVANLQYVIMQSYPYEGDAKQAVKDLADNGIAATVEKGLSWSPKWYCVVGTRGFDHCSNNPEYDAYLASINAVNEKRKNVPKFQRFQPNPYRWNKTK